MGDVMSFPNTFEKFAEQYKIVDKQEVYTNGTELIPIFRVKQWLYERPTADVVQKREYEQLKAIYADNETQRAYTINMLAEHLEKAKSEVERLQKENAELLLSETTELHLSMESLINVRVEHPIFKAIEGKVAWEIFDAFDKAIGSCEAWDQLPAVLLQLLAELKQKYSERSNDDNRTEHKETPKR